MNKQQAWNEYSSKLDGKITSEMRQAFDAGFDAANKSNLVFVGWVESCYHDRPNNQFEITTVFENPLECGTELYYFK